MTVDEESSSNLRRLRNRPLCIICGRPAEAMEIAAALGIDGEAHRLQGHQVSKVRDGHTFYLGEFTLPRGGTLRYYITSSLRAGIQSFTINAALLFSILTPRFVIHAGVCAGYDDPKKKIVMNLRDVVFGEAAINYEEGKWDTVDGQAVFRPDYKSATVQAGDMQAFAESHDRPSFHYGEYLSGSAVRTDASAIFEKIRNDVNRNAIALDMEASAFLQLCEHLSPKGPKCLGILKGISDFGNAAKGHEKGVYEDALRNTAAAIKEWTLHQIPVIDWEVDESDEPAAKIVRGYYDNFVRRVLDNHVDSAEVTHKDDSSIVIPTKDIKGLKSILPKEKKPWNVKEIQAIVELTRKYGITEVRIGSGAGERYLLYKGGYFIDWCRCVNSLEQYEDAIYQVEAFARLLNKEGYYRSSGDGTPLATVVTWEETMDWLDSLAKEEAAVKDAARNAALFAASKKIRHRQGLRESQTSVSTSNVNRPNPVPVGTRPDAEPAIARRMKSLTQMFRSKKNVRADIAPPVPMIANSRGV